MKISLIDDDVVVHFIFNTTIRLYDSTIQTDCYIDSTTALEQIRTRKFESDLILLDIQMPRLNGWQFLVEYEKTELQIPIYLLSSSNNPLDIEHSKKFSSVNGYFIKPLEMAHLDEMLQKLMK